jgi:hypothetical protein
MQKFPVLRSGFVGLTMEGMKKPTSAFDATAAAILNKQRLEPDDDYFYHESTQRLFVRLMNEGQIGKLKELPFQEEILHAAREAFGTTNFWEWVSLQEDSPTFSPIHQAFIIDTMNYICGTPRKMHVQRWIGLLEANTNQNREAIRTVRYDDSIREFREGKMISANLASVFVQWLRQPQGFYDFMCSLEAIFGNRRSLILA